MAAQIRDIFAVLQHNPSPVVLVATRGVARRAVNTNSLQLGHEETFSFTPPAFLLPSSQSALFRCKKFWPLQPLLANLPPDLQCLENCRAEAPLQSLPWGAGLKSVRLIILRKPPTATSEARLLPWYPSEAFLCFPLPPHCHNPDTLLWWQPHPRPVSQPVSGLDRHPSAVWLQHPSVPMSSVLTQPEGRYLVSGLHVAQWKGALKYC